MSGSTHSFKREHASGRPYSYRRKIFEVLNQRAEPLSDRDMINILQAADVNNVRPEITRLVQDGILQECGEKKCPQTGRTVRIVRVAPGARYFDKNKQGPVFPPSTAPLQLGLFETKRSW